MEKAKRRLLVVSSSTDVSMSARLSRRVASEQSHPGTEMDKML